MSSPTCASSTITALLGYRRLLYPEHRAARRELNARAPTLRIYEESIDAYPHTMLRVADLERSLRFYTEVLGMRLLRRKDYRGANSPWPSSVTATKRYRGDELTHNWAWTSTSSATPSATSPSQWDDAYKAARK